MLQQHPTAGLQILPSLADDMRQIGQPTVACDQRRQRLKAHIAFGEMRVGGVDIGGLLTIVAKRCPASALNQSL